MSTFISKRIQTLFVETADGDLALSAKSGEDPEIKPFVGEVEDTDDGMTNDGQLIVNYVPKRSYIQGVFGYKDSDVALIQSVIEALRVDPSGEVPVNCLMTDGSIYSNSGTFAGPIVYNGTGTIELKFVSALDWVQS